MRGAWAFLRNSDNRGALTMIGGAIAAIVVAAWAYYTYEPKSTASSPPPVAKTPFGKQPSTPKPQLVAPDPIGDTSSPKRQFPSPEDIVADIAARPPFQQQDAGQQYAGVKVEWLTVFYSARQEPGDKVLLTMSREGSCPCVFCLLPLSDHPEVKTLKQNTRVRIRGEIQSVNENSISLNACSIEIIR